MLFTDLMETITIPDYVIDMVKVLVVFMGLSLIVAYVVYVERKVLAHMQVRLGPMRVGPHGLLQPIADGIKLLLKEDIVPRGADKIIFLLAPVIAVVASFTAFALIPFADNFVIADLNIGILFLLAISSTGVLGIILGGWSSNSHYPLLGAMRGAAQMVSYEVALGFAIIAALLLSESLSMVEIVKAQAEAGVWFIFWQPVAFFILLVAAVAETNRNPFDLPEAESELVAGFHTEYSGFRFSLYFLAEYAAMILVSAIATTLFLGGWLRPFQNVRYVGDALFWVPPVLFVLASLWLIIHLRKMPSSPDWQWQRMYMFIFAAGALGLAGLLAIPDVLEAVQGVFWFMAKVFTILFGFIWFRGTFPRYRFDQLMNLGWRFMIPVAIVNVITCAIGLILAREKGWNQSLTLGAASLATLLVALPFTGRRN